MQHRETRSPVARAIGLGSARSGTHHWWVERVSAIALIPLTLWFLAAIIRRGRSGYGEFVGWLQSPVAMIVTILLLTALARHMALGLQVVIEDYSHSSAKYALIVLVHAASYVLMAAGILATLRIGLAS